VVPVSRETEPFVLFGSEFTEWQARFSPDGRWVAYASDEPGPFEIYVQSFPDGKYKKRISVNGGVHPTWRGDGRELFFWGRVEPCRYGDEGRSEG
jgi:Tol biopolymer transport system component